MREAISTARAYMAELGNALEDAQQDPPPNVPKPPWVMEDRKRYEKTLRSAVNTTSGEPLYVSWKTENQGLKSQKNTLPQMSRTANWKTNWQNSGTNNYTRVLAPKESYDYGVMTTRTSPRWPRLAQRKDRDATICWNPCWLSSVFHRFH